MADVAHKDLPVVPLALDDLVLIADTSDAGNSKNVTRVASLTTQQTAADGTAVAALTSGGVLLDAVGVAVLTKSGAATTFPGPLSIGAGNVMLLAGTANIAEQRNGTAAQTFRLYNTFTDTSNGEWGAMQWSGNVLQIGTFANGSGTVRAVNLVGNIGINTINPLNRLHVFSTTTADGIALDGTANPAIILRHNSVVRGYAPVIVTNAGAFFTDTLVGDMAFRSEAHRIRLGSGSSASTLVIGQGAVGVNVSSPTADLHIAAGTAAAGTAPLKLTAGANLTTPENGAFEFDGTNLYFTAGGTRRTINWT